MINKICIALLAIFLMQAVALAKDPPPVTDDSISDLVRIKLAGDQLVGVLNFQVTVKGGVVTLGGVVEQKSLKARAEKLTKKVKGVKSVVNNIEIKSRITGK
jgi:osmotically-inducible protein OsmY